MRKAVSPLLALLLGLHFFPDVAAGPQPAHLAPATAFQLHERTREFINAALDRPAETEISFSDLYNFHRLLRQPAVPGIPAPTVRLWEFLRRECPAAVALEPLPGKPASRVAPVVALSINPTLDLGLEWLHEGGKLRLRRAHQSLGGKSVNVAKALAGFGDQVRLVGLMGKGPVSQEHERMLRQIPGIKTEFFHFDGDIRVPVHLNGRQANQSPFELYYSSAILPLKPQEAAGFFRMAEENALGKLAPGSYLVTGGRFPFAQETGLFISLLKQARDRGVRVVVDLHKSYTAGQIREILAARPFLIKTNHEEFAHLAGQESDAANMGTQRIERLARTALAENQIEMMLITRGEKGALLVTPDFTLEAIPPAIAPVSTIGAGDATLAAFLHQLAQGTNLPEALQFAIGAGTATALKPGTGLATLEEARALSRHVLVRSIGVKMSDAPRPIVVALGGNAFGKGDVTKRGKEYWESFRPAVAQAAAEIGELVARGERVVVTFGNGPQAGHEFDAAPQHPLFEHVKTTQREMGKLLEQEIARALKARNILKTPVFSVRTHVAVDSSDPAFDTPTKPIGWFTEEEAAHLAARRAGWKIVDARRNHPKNWRLLVPSPLPGTIIEEDIVREHLSSGRVVIACGGGGIPVDEQGNQREAVIDKDLASARLATLLGAKMLVILTEARGVSLDFKTAETSAYEKEMSVKEVEMLLRQDPEKKAFPDGSIRPKMTGGRNFAADAPHHTDCSVIAPLGALLDAVDGKTGTRILKSEARATFHMPPTFRFDPARRRGLETAA